jgi:hypothetical protein
MGLCKLHEPARSTKKLILSPLMKKRIRETIDRITYELDGYPEKKLKVMRETQKTCGNCEHGMFYKKDCPLVDTRLVRD